MKKIVLAFLFSMYFVNANSQDILDTVSNEVCSCVNQKSEQIKSDNPTAVKMELGMCIMKSVSAHEKEIVAKYGEVLEKGDGMKKLGRDVGLKMAVSCPEVLMQIAKNGFSGDELERQIQETPRIDGKIVEIKQEQFLSVVVKDNSGRTHSLIMLSFFEDSNLLIENKLKKDDNVSVEYLEEEFYDIKAKDFRYYKVIRGIKKK